MDWKRIGKTEKEKDKETAKEREKKYLRKNMRVERLTERKSDGGRQGDLIMEGMSLGDLGLLFSAPSRP